MTHPKRKQIWHGEPASSNCMCDRHYRCAGTRYSFEGYVTECGCPCHPWYVVPERRWRSPVSDNSDQNVA